MQFLDNKKHVLAIQFRDGGVVLRTAIYGDIGSYGMKSVDYSYNRSGRVWVEDFLENWGAAMDEINDHC